MRVTLFVVAGLVLGGCSLPDQETFAPSPEPAAPTPAAAPRVDPRTPLLVIGYDTPDPHYEELLRYAIRAAETRAPGVDYDVVAILPAGRPPDVVTGDAVEVMRSIVAQGVPASRIHLGLRTEPAIATRQIRVYVH